MWPAVSHSMAAPFREPQQGCCRWASPQVLQAMTNCLQLLQGLFAVIVGCSCCVISVCQQLLQKTPSFYWVGVSGAQPSRGTPCLSSSDALYSTRNGKSNIPSQLMGPCGQVMEMCAWDVFPRRSVRSRGSALGLEQSWSNGASPAECPSPPLQG